MSKEETNEGSKEQKDQNVEVDDLPVEESNADQVTGGTGNTYRGLTNVNNGILQ